jgi:hypothetical protein
MAMNNTLFSDLLASIRDMGRHARGEPVTDAREAQIEAPDVKALRQGKIPFEISDPFYTEKNQARLARSIAHAEAGKVTVHELAED